MTDETRCSEKACPYPRKADQPRCEYHERLRYGPPEQRAQQPQRDEVLERAKAYLLGWVN